LQAAFERRPKGASSVQPAGLLRRELSGSDQPHRRLHDEIALPDLVGNQSFASTNDVSSNCWRPCRCVSRTFNLSANVPRIRMLIRFGVPRRRPPVFLPRAKSRSREGDSAGCTQPMKLSGGRPPIGRVLQQITLESRHRGLDRADLQRPRLPHVKALRPRPHIGQRGRGLEDRVRVVRCSA
jgi:hypothetical protein